MSEDLAFLRAVLARPEDNTLRLVYADWLDERDDLRATFLRLEVELNQTEPGVRSGELRERLHQVRSHLIVVGWPSWTVRSPVGVSPGQTGPRPRKPTARRYRCSFITSVITLVNIGVYADGYRLLGLR